MILICLRVENLAHPAVPSLMLTCEDCRHPVWRSKSAIISDPRGIILCVDCGITRAQRIRAADPKGKAALDVAVDTNIALALVASGDQDLIRPLPG